MTDIVERLRSLNADFLHEEAADEIERLRAERDRLATEVSRAHKDALVWMKKAAAAQGELMRAEGAQP